MSTAFAMDPTLEWPTLSDESAEDALQSWVDVDPMKRRIVCIRCLGEWRVGAFDYGIYATAWGYGTTRERADRELVRRMRREGAL